MDHLSPISGSNAARVPTPRYVAAAVNFNNSEPRPPKKRQKRNKPTLSCEECVERKTKVCIVIFSPFRLSSVVLHPGRQSLMVLMSRVYSPVALFASL